MSLKDDKRQNIQLQLDFSSAPTGEARKAGREETESLRATMDPKARLEPNRLMEEICERENLKEALRQVKANKGSAGVDGMTVDGIDRLPEAALASHSGTTVERDLCAEAGEAGRNPEAGRRGAKAWHPDGAGSIHPASGDAGSAKAVGPDVFRSQLRVPAGTVRSSGGGTGAAVYRRRLRLGGGS